MGIPRPDRQEKLVASILYAADVDLGALLVELEGAWGPIDYLGPELAFDHTDYYTEEMGAPLRRRVAAFRRFIDPADLPVVKITSNRIEDQGRNERGGRRINIDPGCLAAESLVLATTKNFAHRIYLGRGIFADLTLLYRGRAYEALEWTYPDYALEAMGAVFEAIRRGMMVRRRLAAPGAVRSTLSQDVKEES